MSDNNIENLSVKRFNQISDPAAHKPIAALDAAYEAIRSGESSPDHVIVLFGRTTKDGASACRFFQAGKYAYHAQAGLCMEGWIHIREN